MAANIQEAMLKKMSPVLLPSQTNPTAHFFQDEDWCGNKTKSNGRHYTFSLIHTQNFNWKSAIRLLWFETPPPGGTYIRPLPTNFVCGPADPVLPGVAHIMGYQKKNGAHFCFHSLVQRKIENFRPDWGATTSVYRFQKCLQPKVVHFKNIL